MLCDDPLGGIDQQLLDAQPRLAGVLIAVLALFLQLAQCARPMNRRDCCVWIAVLATAVHPTVYVSNVLVDDLCFVAPPEFVPSFLAAVVFHFPLQQLETAGLGLGCGQLGVVVVVVRLVVVGNTLAAVGVVLGIVGAAVAVGIAVAVAVVAAVVAAAAAAVVVGSTVAVVEEVLVGIVVAAEVIVGIVVAAEVIVGTVVVVEVIGCIVVAEEVIVGTVVGAAVEEGTQPYVVGTLYLSVLVRLVIVTVSEG